MTRIAVVPLLLCAVLAISTLSGCSHFNNPLIGLEDNDTEAPRSEINLSNLEFVAADLQLEPSIDPNCLVSAQDWANYSGPDFNDLWTRIRGNFQLGVQHNARIDTHLKWHLRNPAYLQRVSERASRYLFSIVEKIEARNMPMELALLPIVESAFDPFAYSPGRAHGMWQFIPATGKRYGLKQNFWYDGRRDVEASTDAALNYLSHLHKRFDGDWLLALAAYNTGEGNVAKAIRRNKRAGKATDFWSLRLPRETESYVPQLLALSNLVAQSEHYNITLQPIANEPVYNIVKLESQIDLAQAAELAQIDMDDLYLLNPGFNQWATDPDGPHRLLLPVAQSDIFIENLRNNPPENQLKWHNYTIKNGDSLLTIAKRFNVTVSTLKDVNNIRGSMIRAGKDLLIPIATKPADHYALSAEQRLQQTQSRSRGKDGTSKVTYHVKSGDSFWKISRRYNVTVNQLAKWNGLAPIDKLHPGQKLVLWSDKVSTTNTFLAHAPQTNEIIRKVNYRVRSGDSLARIASKFNLRITDIVNWNSIQQQKYIHPGQLLTLWVDVTQAQ